MRIIRQDGDFNKAEVFNMTQGSSVEKVSDLAGEVINLKGYIYYEDENKDGESQLVLALLDEDGTISATISTTFIDQFNRIIDYMGDDKFNVRVVKGTSKNNREFITCEIVEK